MAINARDPITGDMIRVDNGDLPIASAGQLGGVKVGNGLEVSNDGTLSVDAIDAVTDVYGSKNLNSYPYYNTTKTDNGITFTDNGDGTITASGVATGEAEFCFHNRLSVNQELIIKNGQYIGSGVPAGGSASSYYMDYSITKDGVYHSIGVDYGDGVNLTFDGDDTYISETKVQVTIKVANGTNLTTPITFYPMIRDARITDDTYVPYAMTNRELTELTESIEETKTSKSDLTSIIINGTTNTTGSTIAAGTYFYLNGEYAVAKTNISSGTTFTLNTNYEKKTVGSVLEELNSNLGAAASRGVDGSVTANSTNLVESGGVSRAIANFKNVTISNVDLVPGSSSLSTNTVYVVYE